MTESQQKLIMTRLTNVEEALIERLDDLCRLLAFPLSDLKVAPLSGQRGNKARLTVLSSRSH